MSDDIDFARFRDLAHDVFTKASAGGGRRGHEALSALLDEAEHFLGAIAARRVERPEPPDYADLNEAELDSLFDSFDCGNHSESFRAEVSIRACIRDLRSRLGAARMTIAELLGQLRREHTLLEQHVADPGGSSEDFFESEVAHLAAKLAQYGERPS